MIQILEISIFENNFRQSSKNNEKVIFSKDCEGKICINIEQKEEVFNKINKFAEIDKNIEKEIKRKSEFKRSKSFLESQFNQINQRASISSIHSKNSLRASISTIPSKISFESEKKNNSPFINHDSNRNSVIQQMVMKARKDKIHMNPMDRYLPKTKSNHKLEISLKKKI